MHKRALLLTAATFALLSGPAFAATQTTGCDSGNTTDFTDITTKVTVPVCTSKANKGQAADILIDTNGTITLSQSGTTPTIIPAVTIDSSNQVTNHGTISFSNTNNAIAVQLDTGNTGAYDQIGVIDMTGSGTNKTAILVTNPVSGTTGTFTGIVPTSSTVALTDPAAIYLEAGSTINMAGDGSTAIRLASGDSIVGDIDVAGGITIAPTKAGETTAVAPSIGINLLGALTGDLHIMQGAVIGVGGPGAEGIVVSGGIDGAFINEGTIQAIGQTNPTANSTTNPSSGVGVLIDSSITGGILNNGPDSINPSAASASIVASGQVPALIVAPAPGATSGVEIGVVADPDGIDNGFSLINRGAISASSPSQNGNAIAVHFAGAGVAEPVTFDGGILNAGSISVATVTSSSTIPGTPVTATALDIDAFATVPKLVNTSETGNSGLGSGTISASVSGSQDAVATAILINQNAAGGGSLVEIDNQLNAKISASATSSDDGIATLEAFAIRDVTGSLSTINNAGTITAITSLLKNKAQIAEAIDAGANTTGVTIVNSGTIQGDVILGQGSDIFQIGDATDKGTTLARVVGNIFFGGTTAAGANAVDNLIINANSTFIGQIQEPLGNFVNIAVNSGGTLNITNDGTGIDDVNANVANTCPTTTRACGVQAGTFTTQNGSSLTLNVAQVFNQNGSIANAPDVVVANSASIAQGTNFKIGFGSFISNTNQLNGGASQFVLIGTPSGSLTIDDFASLQTAVEAETPFLFDASGNQVLCTVNVTGGQACTGANIPGSVSGSALVLNLVPKNADDLKLHGFAKTLFAPANQALANDPVLGAAVISAGLPVNGKALDTNTGNALYQKIYSAFAPDVTGEARATAISLTDQASGVVAARQRALRLYAGQEGDTTLWAQEFTQTFNVGNSQQAGGYQDSGFGFVLGADSGDPRNGRYGAAFQFFSGDANERAPRTAKTNSEWYVLTGYTDWRGRGFFFDSQASAGYATIKGQRFISLTQPDGTVVKRDALGNRAAEFLSGGATAGVILSTGGTVFTPQVSVDGLTMRQEGYTETTTGVTDKTTDGFDLTVKPNYASSARIFAGADVRQDINFGDFYLQPEARAGYRYDFLSGEEKVKAAFVSEASNPQAYFSLSGPDPARGNMVLGGSIATTTGAWSIGLNYDYIRGVGGESSVNQVGTFTIVGRM